MTHLMSCDPGEEGLHIEKGYLLFRNSIQKPVCGEQHSGLPPLGLQHVI